MGLRLREPAARVCQTIDDHLDDGPLALGLDAELLATTADAVRDDFLGGNQARFGQARMRIEIGFLPVERALKQHEVDIIDFVDVGIAAVILISLFAEAKDHKATLSKDRIRCCRIAC